MLELKNFPIPITYYQNKNPFLLPKELRSKEEFLHAHIIKQPRKNVQALAPPLSLHPYTLSITSESLQAVAPPLEAYTKSHL